jgi:hypothetical protein
MTQDINALEREIEASRARLDLTIDRLQDKLSVSGIVDDMLGTMRSNRYGSVYDQTLEVIRRNPVPVMLIAAGLGWLIHRMSREPARTGVVQPVSGEAARVPAAESEPARIHDADDALAPSAEPGVQDPLAHGPLGTRRGLDAHA